MGSLRWNTTPIGLKFDHCYLYGRTSVIICNIHEQVGVLLQRDGSYSFSHIRYSSVFMKQKQTRCQCMKSSMQYEEKIVKS